MIEIKFDKDNNKSIAYDNDAKIGECDYIETEETWNIVHTEVSNLYQGQGIARKLVENIIENAKKYNKKLIADCSYAKKIIDKN
ncbi:MAG: N-acetyltransferase [Clostridia bacterium]|nr:N-acetyltransferase [Clostridia bacterium]